MSNEITVGDLQKIWQGTYNRVSLTASDSFKGSGNVTKTFTEDKLGFVISNDGNSELDFTISGNVFTVMAGEVFEANFAPFREVAISGSVPFRAYSLSADNS